MITIQLDADDLTRLRFAFSPLWELAASYWALRTPSLHAIHLPWIHEAHAALEQVELPHLDALITADGQFASFFTPTPDTPRPSFEEELERLEQVSSEEIVGDVRDLRIQSAAAAHFLNAPQAALAALIDEARRYWQLTLAHHWPRIHAVLESDVIYRARQLALEGAGGVFNDLHPNIHYVDHMIQIDARHQGSLTPGGSGLILVPLVFTWNDIIIPDKDAPGIPVIAYSVRGGGLWSHQAEEPSEALIAALGEGRANVLLQITTPRSTSELAQRLEVTPGNISLHIARLREAGLVESQQLGKWVFHRLTPRGEHLLALFAP